MFDPLELMKHKLTPLGSMQPANFCLYLTESVVLHSIIAQRIHVLNYNFDIIGNLTLLEVP